MNTTGRYRVCIIMPQGYIHSSAFVEVAFLLKASFGGLGFDCDLKINELAEDRTNILLGSHLISFSEDLRRYEYIPYQLEQLSANEGLYNQNVKSILASAKTVWDYSAENIAFLQSQGIAARHLPVGYHPALEQIPQAPDKDVDVLFYGSTGGRRKPILDILDGRSDVRTKSLFGVYGRDRDLWIGRSKIILNIHYYAVKIFEAVRVAYLLNNRCFVLSEESAINPYPGISVTTSPYENLVESCVEFSRSDSKRESLASQTYEQFRTLYPMTSLLGSIL